VNWGELCEFIIIAMICSPIAAVSIAVVIIVLREH
jgi:hypothetical protein